MNITPDTEGNNWTKWQSVHVACVKVSKKNSQNCRKNISRCSLTTSLENIWCTLIIILNLLTDSKTPLKQYLQQQHKTRCKPGHDFNFDRNFLKPLCYSFFCHCKIDAEHFCKMSSRAKGTFFIHNSPLTRLPNKQCSLLHLLEDNNTQLRIGRYTSTNDNPQCPWWGWS